LGRDRSFGEPPAWDIPNVALVAVWKKRYELNLTFRIYDL
jgi:hypothetical protein